MFSSLSWTDYWGTGVWDGMVKELVTGGKLSLADYYGNQIGGSRTSWLQESRKGDDKKSLQVFATGWWD